MTLAEDLFKTTSVKLNVAYLVLGEQCAIMRGSWFYDGSWQPLEGDRCEQVENVHLCLFANHCVSEYISSNNPKQPKQGTVLIFMGSP